MKKVLTDFLSLKINLSQLKEILGDNLYDVQITKPEIVYVKDLIFLINQYISDIITVQVVVDWVNVVWFTDLYEYNSLEEDAIASVMSILETIDEDDVQISEKEFITMMDCLSNNEVYKS